MSTESTHYKIATFYKGQTIFKEGQQANTAYLVKTGLVAIQKKADNAQTILAHIKAG